MKQCFEQGMELFEAEQRGEENAEVASPQGQGKDHLMAFKQARSAQLILSLS